MNTEVSGRCWVCGDDVSVYQIIQEERWTMDRMDPSAMGDWVCETLEPGLKGVKGGFKAMGYSILVAGREFGCGNKSVEHPMAALKGAGIRLILAESASRYSYRNALNLALPVVICPGVTRRIRRDDEIAVNIQTGTIHNRTTGESWQAAGLGDFATEMICAGGLLRYVAAERQGQAGPAEFLGG